MNSFSKKYIVALDQGTTSSRAIILDAKANIIKIVQREFSQIYPHKEWVEQDPMEIWATQSSAFTEVIEMSNINYAEIAGIGISNQRETTVVWNKKTGLPVYNAIVWQCRRTSDLCKELKEDKTFEDYVIENTGLLLDPYFSATKLRWILDNVPNAQQMAENGELLFGTIDTWLIWKLTQGQLFITDYTNASRTMMFNIHKLEWDDVVLKKLNIPKIMLPEVKNSSQVYGETNIGGRSGLHIPIAGIAGDQQAALFGHLCVKPFMAKNTYGTGCFMLMNTGTTPIKSKHKLLTTICCDEKGNPNFALEGSVFIGGAAIQWLRDEMHIIHDSADSEYFANKIPDSDGIYVVPAFTGLGAPYWNPYARGAILGITRRTNRNHIVRATLEAIAYQIKDVIEAMQKDANRKISILRVDGGAVANNFLMQFQADILDTDIELLKVKEATSLGVAYLAGLAVGFWKNINEIKDIISIEKRFIPNMKEEDRVKMYNGWKDAIGRINRL